MLRFLDSANSVNCGLRIAAGAVRIIVCILTFMALLHVLSIEHRALSIKHVIER